MGADCSDSQHSFKDKETGVQKAKQHLHHSLWPLVKLLKTNKIERGQGIHSISMSSSLTFMSLCPTHLAEGLKGAGRFGGGR